MKTVKLFFTCTALLSIVLYACSNNSANKTATTSDSSAAMKDSSMQGMKMDSSMKGMKMDSTKH